MSHMTIDLSDKDAAVLAVLARAAEMSPESFSSHIVSSALERQHSRTAEQLARHLDTMASQIHTETTPEDMEEALGEALDAVRPQRDWQL